MNEQTKTKTEKHLKNLESDMRSKLAEIDWVAINETLRNTFAAVSEALMVARDKIVALWDNVKTTIGEMPEDEFREMLSSAELSQEQRMFLLAIRRTYEHNTYRLSEVEEVISNHDDDLFDSDSVLISDEMIMELGGTRVFISSLNWTLRTGVVSMLNESSGEFEPDFSITAIYEGTGEDPEKWLYYGQDGFVTTVHNYLLSTRGQEAAVDEGELQCSICFHTEHTI